MHNSAKQLASVLLALTAQVGMILPAPVAMAQGPVPMPMPVHIQRVAPGAARSKAAMKKAHHKYPGSVRIKSHGGKKKKRSKKPAAPPPPPQQYVGNLATRTIATGIQHKVHRGAMYINLLDIDLKKADVVVKPVMAGTSFNTLQDVRDQAAKSRALAAVNGNYFKRDGTPLGTLIIDGEWIAGPIFDRTCMGITRDGRVLVDRVQLHGNLTTDNAEAPAIWVNNVNQPRRSGAHVIAYTRRWGDNVKMAYEGTLVAVDAAGKVIAKDGWNLAIPLGGYVLSDSKESQIAKLNVGDSCNLQWQTNPPEWSNVVNAVSGGPVLIRDGNLYVGCKDERFCKSWTGNQIQARTAVGVTADRHLLLATIEGRHTLYDVAKFLRKLGAVDAMNLDGGGSTTMVIGGRTVTRNSSKFERRVASSLAVLPRSVAAPVVVQYNGAQKLETGNGGAVAPSGNAPAPSVAPAVVPAATAPSVAPNVVNAARVTTAPPVAEQAVRNNAMLPIVPAMAMQGAATAAPTTPPPAKGSKWRWVKHLNGLGE